MSMWDSFSSPCKPCFQSLLAKLFVGQATDCFSSGINPLSYFPKCKTIPLNAIWNKAVGVMSANSKSQKDHSYGLGQFRQHLRIEQLSPKAKDNVDVVIAWSHAAWSSTELYTLRMFSKRWTNQENIPSQFRRHHTLSLAAWNNNEYSQYNCTSVQCSYCLTSDKLYNLQYKYLRLS